MRGFCAVAISLSQLKKRVKAHDHIRKAGGVRARLCRAERLVGCNVIHQRRSEPGAPTAPTCRRVGIRFTGVNVPSGATITNAYIQFQAKEAWTGTTSVVIHGENSANATPFANVTNNVSSRAQTAASVAWTIAPWNTVGAAGLDQRTPDLTSVVQQIVGAGGWSALNSMAFIVTGSGTRTAWAYDGNPAAAPLLHIEYTLNATPVVGDISISDVSISEGDSGTKTATFTVSRTGTAAFAVNYATADQTAAAGSDYVASSGTLNFAQGQATQTVSVTINGDTLVEPNETFFVNLSNPTNGGAIIDSQGLGTITNDDVTAAVGDISISDVSISEGDSGTKTATFTVSRTGTAAFAVNYATADQTAAAGSDYVASSGTLNFAQGQATQTVSVTINGDTLVEPDETFFVNLSNPTNGGAIIDSQGLGTITNDDAGWRHFDQRRLDQRGRQRHKDGDLHGEPYGHGGFRRQLRHSRPDGCRRQRLCGELGHAELRSGPGDADGLSDDQRRHARRAQRDLLRQPF